MLPTRDPPQNKTPTQAESEGLEKNIPNKWTQKKETTVAIIISDKTDFKSSIIKRDPGHSIILEKNSSRRHKHYKHIVPHKGAPKHTRKILEPSRNSTATLLQ